MNRARTFHSARVLTVAAVSLALLVGSSGCGSTSNDGEPSADSVTLTVLAAPVFTDVLDEVAEAYTASHPEVTFNISYGASGTTQAQIEQGAVADIFFSAASKFMDPLEEDGLLVPDTRANVLANDLVLIVPSDSTLNLSSVEDLTAPDVSLVALGDPASVSAGVYAMQSLTAAGVADAVSAKAVLAKDVRQALTYVETGDAEAGIVFMTDALSSDKVKIAFTIPSDSHDPIVYPAAVLSVSENQAAADAFIEYLSSDEAVAIFESYGFTAIK